MNSNQLKSYIAPAAPATRAPCDGSEPALRVEFGFTPRWFHARCGIDFSERWHLDALYRRETSVAMRRELNRRFPALRLGGEAPDESPATIDGVHGALLMAMLFDIPVEYYAENWPAARHAVLDAARAARLEVPELSACRAFAQLDDQMDAIEREFGRIEGYVNWQGVLNTAYRLRGTAIFTDVMTDPALADHVFDVVARTMIAGMKFVYERQRSTGVIVRHATVSNCLVNMVAPETYRERLFPHDRRIAEAFEVFGVHNCAWNADLYLEDYARLPSLGYVDMGLETDLERARRLCPGARRAVMYTPMDLATKSWEEIRADIERIHAAMAPCDVVMADIDHEIPDERVLRFAEMARETLDRRS